MLHSRINTVQRQDSTQASSLSSVADSMSSITSAIPVSLTLLKPTCPLAGLLACSLWAFDLGL